MTALERLEKFAEKKGKSIQKKNKGKKANTVNSAEKEKALLFEIATDLGYIK